MLAFTLNDFAFQSLPVEFFNPHEQVVTWFLLALLVWRVSLPTILRTRAPLLFSTLLGLAALFADLGVNYQNIFAFLPYFVLGARLPRDVWTQLDRPELRCPLGGLFVACTFGVVAFSAAPRGYGGATFSNAFEQLTLTYSCFDGSPPAEKRLDCCSLRELLLRAAFYLASLPLIAGFLCTMPRTTSWLTAPGFMSMYVYLLHPLLLYNPLAMKLSFDALSEHYGREVTVWSPATEGSAYAVLVPASLLCCAALSTPWTRACLWPLVEPPTERVLFDVDKPAAALSTSPSTRPLVPSLSSVSLSL